MKPEIDVLANQVLGALGNSVYQGFLLTLTILLLLKLAPRTNAATRHAVALVALLVVAGLPVCQFLQGPATTQILRHKELSAAGGGRSLASEPDRFLSVRAAGQDGMAESLDDFAPTDPDLPREAAERTEPGSRNFSAVPAANAVDNAPGPLLRWAGLLPLNPWSWHLSLPKNASVVLVGLWLLLASARLGRLACQYGRLQVLKRRGGPAPANLTTLYDSLRTELAIKRPGRLRMSPEMDAPMVLGFRQPMVLLPTKLFADITEVQKDQILRHELAHVGRYDDWVNLSQQVIHAVLFFNPAVWWLSHRMTTDREIACDDFVLATSRNARAYALFLTEFASRTQDRNWMAAPAAWSNKKQLKQRITMILNPKRNCSPRPNLARVGVLTAVAASIAFLGLYAFPRLAFGEEPTSPAAPGAAEGRQPTQASKSTGQKPALKAPPSAVQARADGDDEDGVEASAGDASLLGKIDPGPKPKAPTTTPLNALGLPQMAPPHVPMALARGRAMAVAQAPVEPGQPLPPEVPHVRAVPRKVGDDSIEARLARLERLVESLMARETRRQAKAPAGENNSWLKGPAAEAFAKPVLGDLPKLPDNFKAEIARITEQAKRAAEQATRDARLAIEDARRAAREAARLQWRKDPTEDLSNLDARALDARRAGLESQQQALDKQLQEIAQQLARLKQQKEKIKADLERSKQEKRAEERYHRDQLRQSEKAAPDSVPSDSSSDEEKKVKKQ